MSARRLDIAVLAGSWSTNIGNALPTRIDAELLACEKSALIEWLGERLARL